MSKVVFALACPARLAAGRVLARPLAGDVHADADVLTVIGYRNTILGLEQPINDEDAVRTSATTPDTPRPSPMDIAIL